MMKDPKEALEELLAEMIQAEARSIEAKLRSIIKCADPYVTEISDERADEFFHHLAQICVMALDLLPGCSTVRDSKQLALLKIELEEIWNYAGMLYALRSPERIEDFHAAA